MILLDILLRDQQDHFWFFSTQVNSYDANLIVLQLTQVTGSDTCYPQETSNTLYVKNHILRYFVGLLALQQVVNNTEVHFTYKTWRIIVRQLINKSDQENEEKKTIGGLIFLCVSE